jgi:hypothetical protein
MLQTRNRAARWARIRKMHPYKSITIIAELWSVPSLPTRRTTTERRETSRSERAEQRSGGPGVVFRSLVRQAHPPRPESHARSSRVPFFWGIKFHFSARLGQCGRSCRNVFFSRLPVGALTPARLRPRPGSVSLALAARGLRLPGRASDHSQRSIKKRPAAWFPGPWVKHSPRWRRLGSRIEYRMACADRDRGSAPPVSP